jgi:small-conductance mechanosensitive channel
MDELSAKYERQVAEYDAAVKAAIETGDRTAIPKLKELNAGMSKTIDAMIEKLTFLKKDAPNVKQQRDRLIQKLGEIQRDYNGLVVNTDELETLRRIRQQESGEANKQLYFYLGLFLFFVLLLIVYLAFYGKRDTTATIASTVPTTPALM